MQRKENRREKSLVLLVSQLPKPGPLYFLPQLHDWQMFAPLVGDVKGSKDGEFIKCVFPPSFMTGTHLNGTHSKSGPYNSSAGQTKRSKAGQEVEIKTVHFSSLPWLNSTNSAVGKGPKLGLLLC